MSGPLVLITDSAFRAEPRHMAIGLSRRSIPFSFQTSAYVHPGSRALRPAQPLPAVRELLLRRHEPHLAASRVTSWVFPDVVRRVARGVPPLRPLTPLGVDAAFDAVVAHTVRHGVGLVVAMQGGALRTVRRAHGRGARAVVVANTPDALTEAQIVAEEEARLGLRRDASVGALARRMAARIRTEQAEADVVVANSDFTRDDLIRHGVDAAKVVTLELGVDVRRFVAVRREPSAARGRRIVYVGSVQARKGVVHLARAARRLREGGIDCVVAAYGLVDPRYGRVLGPLVESGALSLLGPVSYQRLPEVYAEADVFAFPTLSDGFGLVVLEAMACGVPVVVSDRCGAPVRDGENGLVVPHRDSEGLADALGRVLVGDALAERLSASGLETARASSWEAYEAAACRLICALAGGLPYVSAAVRSAEDVRRCA